MAADQVGPVRVDRRTFVTGLGAAGALASTALRSARAQAQRPVIGFLNPQTPAASRPTTGCSPASWQNSAPALLDTGAADGGVGIRARAARLCRGPAAARIEAAVAALVAHRVQGFALSPSATFDVNKDKIVPAVNAARIVSVYPGVAWMSAGGLVSTSGLPSTSPSAGQLAKSPRSSRVPSPPTFRSNWWTA